MGVWPIRKRWGANAQIHFSNRKYQPACEWKRKIHYETSIFLPSVFQFIFFSTRLKTIQVSNKMCSAKERERKKLRARFSVVKVFHHLDRIKNSARLDAKSFRFQLLVQLKLCANEITIDSDFFLRGIFSHFDFDFFCTVEIDGKERDRKRWQKRMLWSAAPLHLRSGRNRLAASQEQSVFISFPFWFIEKWVNKYLQRAGHKAHGKRWAAGNYSENW